MARKTIGPLSLADLKQVMKDPRFDHPSRKGIEFGQQQLLPKRRAPFRDESGKVHHVAVSYGEFIANPPECVGLRRVPSGLEVEAVESMRALQSRPAGEAHPANWVEQIKEDGGE